MPNYIEINDTVTARRFVSSSSRYIDSKLIYYTENKITTFTTYKKSKEPYIGDVRYTVISKNYEYRPDLLSYEAYGLSEFWWQILEFNGIKDVYDFKAGLNITIPQNFFR